MNKAELIKELYTNQNYPKILNIIKYEKDPFFLNLKARVFFLMHNLSQAKKYYTLAKAYYELGYCFFIDTEYEKALEVWATKTPDSSVKEWSICITKLLLGLSNELPSYFQIRNYLELDIENLILFGAQAKANKLLDLMPQLSQINIEVYKSAARVFINHNLYEDAIKLLQHFLNHLYKDPEARFSLAQCYLKLNKKEEAIYELEKCLSINTSYFPAKQELQKQKASFFA